MVSGVEGLSSVAPQHSNAPAVPREKSIAPLMQLVDADMQRVNQMILDMAAANAEMTSLNFLDATDQICRGAARRLLSEGGAKVGVTGFCMGGAMTILCAARVSEFTAGAPFYGLPPAAAAGPADVKIPLQGHFALQDDWCTPQAVNDFEAGLKTAGKAHEFFSYDAHHGFMNEARPDVHQAKAAEDAWKRVVAFFQKQLG